MDITTFMIAVYCLIEDSLPQRRLHKTTRTTFTRQATNLWRVKQELWQALAQQVEQDRSISIVDSFPGPVCRFARTPRCQSFGEIAAFGHDEVARQTYYGLPAHVRLAWPGVLVDCSLAPANLHDTEAAEELLQRGYGFALVDRNYWKPELRERLKTQGLHLLTPYKSAKRQKQPYNKPHTSVNKNLTYNPLISIPCAWTSMFQRPVAFW